MILIKIYEYFSVVDPDNFAPDPDHILQDKNNGISQNI